MSQPNTANDQENNFKQPITVLNIPNYQPNYATKMESPRKEEAIIIEANENLNLLDYASTVSKITNQPIKFIGKISRNRIRMFLPTEQEANQFTSKHPVIEIKGFKLKTRPYINSAKKLYISGACPSIPNDYLTKCLEILNIQLIAPMQHIKAFHTEENNLSNTHLDKRFILCKPSLENSIPSSVIILYDDIEHMIYLEIENNLCRKCKLMGHSASKCPNIITTTDIQNRLQKATTDSKAPETQTIDIPNNSQTHNENVSKETTGTEEEATNELNGNANNYRDPGSYVTMCYEETEDHGQEHLPPSQIPEKQKGTGIVYTNIEGKSNPNQDKDAAINTEKVNPNLHSTPPEKQTINDTWITPTRKLTRNQKNLTIKTDNLNPPKEKIQSPKRKLDEKLKTEQSFKLPKK